MDWRIKGTVQKILGYIPAGERAHYALQRRFGGLRDFSSEFDAKIEDWRLMAGHLRDAGRSIKGARMVEIGSGWYPTFPLACYLGGASDVTTFDLTRHLKPDLVHECIARLRDAVSTIAKTCAIDEHEVLERYNRLRVQLDRSTDPDRLTGGVIRYVAPANASRSGLADESIDCVFSNSVLEHVPRESIIALYKESLRILAQGGVMFHSVNCGDHYAYVDRSINQLNYLKYSNRTWSRWNNTFLYQNRMRAHEFVVLAKEAGFNIELDTARATEAKLAQLASIPVHAQFLGVDPHRLCITSVDFIARKPEDRLLQDRFG